MAIIALKAWYLREYEPIEALQQRPHDLRLNKNSLLKSGLRVDFLDDLEQVKTAEWFQRYLQGEVVEFYIEGSGGYAISNIDLMSQEIYFTKCEVLAHLEPTVFFSYQTEFPESSAMIREGLVWALEQLNPRSRFPLTLAESHRLSGGALRLQSSLMRKLRQCLVFVGDVTTIATIATQNPNAAPDSGRAGEDPLQWLPSPSVCVEVGYALQCKRSEQILLIQQERSSLPGHFPFDLPLPQHLAFGSPGELREPLLGALQQQFQRFHLL